MPNVKNERVAFDSATRDWFKNNIGAETTVAQCSECKLFYKPELGHRCLARAIRKRPKVTIEIP